MFLILILTMFIIIFSFKKVQEDTNILQQIARKVMSV